MNIKINKLLILIVFIVLFYNNVCVMNNMHKIVQEKNVLYNELENNYINNYDALYVLKKQASVINNYFYSGFSLEKYAVDFKDYILVYRYTNSVCGSCLSRDFDVLKLLADKFGKDHLLVVSSATDNRENRIKLNVDLDGIKYLILPDSAWEIPVDKITGTALPFFAMINKNHTIETVVFSDMTNLLNSLIEKLESQ